MLRKRLIIICCGLCLVVAGYAQTDPADTIPVPDQTLAIDTSIDYDDMLNELGAFLDSLIAPRSYFLITATAGNGYFNYTNRNNTAIETKKKLVLSPVVGYYHKSGPGITVSGDMIDDGRKYNLYQYAISPSFDFIKSRKWTGSVYYTRYITKKGLPFYTTPLQNEIDGSFVWRKSWLQPGLAANYGWSRSREVERRERYFELFDIRRNGAPTEDTRDRIADFSLIASVRHSFYWLNLLKHDDYVRLTPMLAFSSGTQQFGFNQTTGSNPATIRNATKIRYNAGNVNLDDRLKFKPLSLTLYLSPEYATGNFFIQPQFILDYYFPAQEKNLTALFSLNIGFVF